MSDPGNDTNELVRRALAAAVADFGDRALSTPQVLRNVFDDYLPDNPRLVDVLTTAAEEGVATTLSQHLQRNMDIGTAVQLTTSALRDRRALDPAASSWAVVEFARAMGHPVPELPAPVLGPAGPAGPPDVSQAAPSYPPPGGYPSTPPSPPGPGFPPGSPPGYAPVPPAGGPSQPGPSVPPGYPLAGGSQPPPLSYGSPGGSQPAPPSYPSGPGQPGPQSFPPSGRSQPPPTGFPPSGASQPPPGFPPSGASQPPPSGFPPSGASQPPPPGFTPYSAPGPLPGGPPRVPQPPTYIPPGGGSGWAASPLGGPTPPPKKKRNPAAFGGLAVVLLVVAYFGVAATAKLPPFSNSTTTTTAPPPPPTTSSSTNTGGGGGATLQSLLPDDVSNCMTFTNPPAGLESAVTNQVCDDAGLGQGAQVYGYQFATNGDYEAAFLAYNNDKQFDQSSAGSSCPPTGSSTEGQDTWHDKAGATGLLECLRVTGTAANTTDPVYIWTIPADNIIFEAIGPDGGSFSALDTWWTNHAQG